MAVGRGARGFHNPGVGCLFKRWRRARRGLFICREFWLPAPRRRKRIQRNKAGPPGEALGRGRDGHSPACPMRVPPTPPPHPTWVHPLEAGPPSSQFTPAPTTPALPPPPAGTHRRTHWETPRSCWPQGGHPGVVGCDIPPPRPPNPGTGHPAAARAGFPRAPRGHGAGCRVSIHPGTGTMAQPRGGDKHRLGSPQDPGSPVQRWGGCPWPPPPTPPSQAMAPEPRWLGGAGGREAQEELFMFAGAKCSPGTAPAVPGPNYSTRSWLPPPPPPIPPHLPARRQPGTERSQHRRPGHPAPQPWQGGYRTPSPFSTPPGTSSCQRGSGDPGWPRSRG